LGQRVQFICGGGCSGHSWPICSLQKQGKRLFGFIGAGGTAGALLGPVVTIWLSAPLGPVNLLIAAAVFLEAAVFCVHRIERVAERADRRGPGRQRVGGSAFAHCPN